MKTVTYKQEDIEVIVSALNKFQVCGIEQARLIACIAGILESGEIKNRHEPPETEGAKK